MMLIARILYPVIALGPGKRIGIWFCGCNRRCNQCANPELQEFDETRAISIDTLTELLLDFIRKYKVDGITLTGGEPFEQAGEIVKLLKVITLHVPDILVFTGYTYKQLIDRHDEMTNDMLKMINVLIDGEYIDSKNTGSVLRGSDNQVIHYLKGKNMDQYKAYLEAGRQFQNFETAEGIISVGLHFRGFMDELQANLKKKIDIC